MQVYVSLVAFITKGFTVLNVFTSIVQNMEKGKQEHSISEEGDIAQSKPKQRAVTLLREEMKKIPVKNARYLR